ncbi:hypothetical protein [Embleya sp. NPDC059259]|uniref:hypothetical protein n=1 Tax=unclassified Embleya TaxID=2699296 RepID=UPI0036B5A7AD
MPVALIVAACLAGCSSTGSGVVSSDGATPATSGQHPTAAGTPSADASAGATAKPTAGTATDSTTGARESTAVRIREALETVRAAHSFRLVVTIRQPGALPHVEDNRIVRGAGARIRKADGDTVTEETVYIGDHLYRRADTGAWEQDTVREDSELASNLLYRNTSSLLGQLHDATAEPGRFTPIQPLTIDGTTCVGWAEPDGTRTYLTPGDHTHLRRLEVDTNNSTITWDFTELDTPVDLTPPTPNHPTTQR